MNRLAKIVQSGTPSAGVQFRKRVYGSSGVRSFLRDVLAMTNASVEGPRYIITGVDFDAKGRKRLHGVKHDDFSGKPDYESLVSEHIEPAVRIRYKAVTIDEKQVGVFEIGDCQDFPYMMRVDHSETLRRGDAYVRVRDSAVKMGRRQLLTMFEENFQDSISSANIEIGFPGEIIHKKLKVATCDFSELPSAIASAKLQEMIEAKNQVNSSYVSTIVARLTFARVFGSDQPYEDRSTEDIVAEMQQLEQQYHDHDDHFLYEEHATSIQLVVYSQSGEPLQHVSYSLLFPVHEEFRIAAQLPKLPRGNSFAERTSLEQSRYPAVTQRDNAIQVSGKLDEIPADEPVEIFATPLRICIGSGLKGRRVGIQYSLSAQNLRSPAKGTLRLLF